jgi:hypothetical protein
VWPLEILTQEDNRERQIDKRDEGLYGQEAADIIQRNQVPEKVRPWLNVNTDYRMREHIVVQPREQNLECRARQQRILH